MKKTAFFFATLLASTITKAQVYLNENGQYYIIKRQKSPTKVAGEGTGTCLSSTRVAGDGTGTCLAGRDTIVFDHPSLLSSRQILDLLKETSSDLDREQIIALLKKGTEIEK